MMQETDWQIMVCNDQRTIEPVQVIRETQCKNTKRVFQVDSHPISFDTEN
jgi:hypothetical protein